MAIDQNVDRVCERHQRRAEHGRQKYGVTTERTDLTPIQWVQHFQDEVMDAAVYAERLKTEMQVMGNRLLQAAGEIEKLQGHRKHGVAAQVRGVAEWMVKVP